jgi:hypothetical protein
MGYWVTAAPDYDYYEGDQQSSTDIAVTERPYYTCTWDGAAWVYDLAATKSAAKMTYSIAMNDDFNAALYSSGDPVTQVCIYGYLAMITDLVSYTDNVANNVPFIDGWLAEKGSGTKADVVSDITGDADIGMASLGKIMYCRKRDFALIDAAATGPDALAVVYVSPL